MDDTDPPKRATRGRPALSGAQRRTGVVKSSYCKVEHKAVHDAAAKVNRKPAVFQRLAAIELARRILQADRRGVPGSPYGG
jgi:hypothetical protein